jgi:hypothetical protein
MGDAGCVQQTRIRRPRPQLSRAQNREQTSASRCEPVTLRVKTRRATVTLSVCAHPRRRTTAWTACTAQSQTQGWAGATFHVSSASFQSAPAACDPAARGNPCSSRISACGLCLRFCRCLRCVVRAEGQGSSEFAGEPNTPLAEGTSAPIEMLNVPLDMSIDMADPFVKASPLGESLCCVCSCVFCSCVARPRPLPFSSSII